MQQANHCPIFEYMDRDRGGGRGDSRHAAKASRDDPGGKRASAGPAPQFVKNIPSFLQQYSHLLNTNKKNYMGEELEHDNTADTADDVAACGGLVVEDCVLPETVADTEDIDPVEVEKERSQHDVFRERAPGFESISSVNVSDADTATGPNEIAKVAFKKPVRKRRFDLDEDLEETGGHDKVNRNYKGCKKKSMLSFDADED